MLVYEFICVEVCCFLLPLLNVVSRRCVCCWKLMIWHFYLCWFMILHMIFLLMLAHHFNCVKVCCFLLPLLGFFSCCMCVVGNFWFDIFTYVGSWFYLCESLLFLWFPLPRFLLILCVCCWKLMIWYFYLCWFMILLVWKSVVPCFPC
jgi:hypothetical protein